MFGRNRLSPYVTENLHEDLIRLENLVKIYDTGAIRVLGLKKISLTIKRLENTIWTALTRPSFPLMSFRLSGI